MNQENVCRRCFLRSNAVILLFEKVRNENKMRTDLKKNASVALFFASFMFLQFTILRMGNQAGWGYLTDGRQEKVYIFLQLFVICGIALHAIPVSALKRGSAPKSVSAAFLSVFGVCFAYMLFAPASSAVYVAVTYAGVFCLGFIAGKVYLAMSEYHASGVSVGICMGVGYSAALLLQYFVQLKWLIKPAVAVFSLGALAWLFVRFLRNMPVDEIKKTRTDRVSAKKAVSACVISAVFLLFTAFYNGYIHHLQIASGYTDFNVYSWPRLLMIPGMLVFGFIGDHKKGRYLPLSALCVSVIAFLNVVLAGSADAYRLNMCLFYIALSAVVSYYNSAFWKLAQGTKHPAIWSVAGRALDSAVVVALSLVSLTDASAGVVLSLNVGALAVIIVVMALSGDFDLSNRETVGQTEQVAENVPEAPTSEDDALSSVAEIYKLTPSELRVFRELVLTEDKQAAVAEKLSVKLRTVQANVTSIYRKTGVTTRSGLLQLYHDVQK